MKKKLNEGFFSSADKFVATFFNTLEKRTADKFIKKVKNTKLPPDAIKHMERIDAHTQKLRDLMDDVDNGNY